MFWPLGSHDKALGLSSKPKTQKHFAGGFKQRAKCAVPWTCSQGGTQRSASREERGRSRSGFQFLFYCAEAPSGRLNLCHPHSTAASPGTESEAASCCNTTSPCCSSQRVGGAECVCDMAFFPSRPVLRNVQVSSPREGDCPVAICPTWGAPSLFSCLHRMATPGRRLCNKRSEV